jgi:hypothetical protein
MRSIGLVVFVPRASSAVLKAAGILKAGGFKTGSSVLWWAQDSVAAREAIRLVAKRSLATDIPVGCGSLPLVESENVDEILAASGAAPVLATSTPGGVAEWMERNPLREEFADMILALSTVPPTVQKLILRVVADRTEAETVPAHRRSQVIAAVDAYLEDQSHQ